MSLPNEAGDGNSWRAAVVEVAARALWLPASVLAAHVLASRVLRGYERFPQLDVPMHLAGGIAIAFLFDRALAVARRRRLVGPVDPRVAAAAILGWTVAAALAWECAEFVSDRLEWSRAQGGLEDTLSDMVIGVVGGGLFLAWRRFSAGPRRP